jgi:hypothetical protein
MKDEIVNIRSTIASSFNSTGWALAIGAGISIPVFDSWNQLAYKMLIKCNSAYSTESVFISDQINKYGPDAVIQGVFNLGSYSEDAYVKILSETLYGKILHELSNDQAETTTKIFNTDSPSRLSPQIWKDFSIIRESYFSKTSAYTIAKIVSEVIGSNKQPDEIISFNAEPLLYSLLASFDYDKQMKVLPSNHSVVKNIDIITSSITNTYRGRLKYIYAHGFLPINGLCKKPLSHNDKLVFRENEYITLSNSAYSWQSSIFTNVVNQKPVLFIGLSLTDPNIRKWLAWVQSIRKRDVEKIEATAKESSRHFWIEIDPGNKERKQLIESIVYHLGIRIIWIQNWNELENCLLNVLQLI